MEQDLIVLSDKTKIYCEYSLDHPEKDTILYLHGGPGLGCWDFRYAANLLAEKYNVIMFDQRGVLRSDSINGDFKSEMLVDDITDIQEHFNVKKVILLGHSYGGHLAVRYGLKYPDKIKKIIFACPTFDFEDSLVSILEHGLLYMKNLEGSRTYKKIEKAISSHQRDCLFKSLMSMPNDIRNKAYHEKPLDKKVESVNNVVLSSASWERGGNQQQAIFSEEDMYVDYRLKLKYLSCDSYLIVGEYDPVCSKSQQTVFAEVFANKHVIMMPESGHMVYTQAPEQFVDIITQIVK